MRLAEKLQDAGDAAGDLAPGQDPRRLYSETMSELEKGIASKTNELRYNTLWASISPTGNIYRYNAVSAEHRKHCEDLWSQLLVLADEYAGLLGGDGLSRENRAEALCAALQTVKVQGTGGAKFGRGFQPLQEYLEERVWRLGPFLVPLGPEHMSQYRNATLMAICVFVVQVLAPFTVFINRWQMDTNYLKNPRALYANLSWAQAFCLGPTLKDKLTTVMGFCLIAVIIFIIRLYVAEETANARKSARLPFDAFWFFTGAFANAWCCVLTACNILLLFWSEETATNIILDSMTLLFVFKLDDMSDALSGLLGLTDTDFQRVVSWNCAMLAQCPVRISDLINKEASSVAELWQIEMDMDYRLLTPIAASVSDRSFPRTACATRLMLAPSHENQPLVPKDLDVGVQLLYQWTPSNKKRLPSRLAPAVWMIWSFIEGFLLLLQFVLPMLWFVVNKPCY